MMSYTIRIETELRFPEPHDLYDRYCTACDMAWERELAAGFCGNCAHYTDSPAKYGSEVRHGWCSLNEDFTEYDHPARDCEDDYDPCHPLC